MKPSAVLARLAQHDCSAHGARSWSRETEQDMRRKVPLMALRTVSRGEYLFRAGEPFQALYLLQQGFIKIVNPGAPGAGRIRSFYVRGDLVGSKSIGHTMYQSDAVALDDCLLWELPYASVLAMCSQDASLHAGLMRARVECTQRERKSAMPRECEPEQAIAELLMDLLSRYIAHGINATDFAVALFPDDIADYLGIELSASRLGMARLCAAGAVARKEGELRIANADALRQLATGATRRSDVVSFAEA